MRPSLPALALCLSALALAACDSSTSSAPDPLTADEQAVAGTWYAEVQGIAKVTFVLNADRTQSNTTLLNDKPFAENSGTWRADHGMAYIMNRKCKALDNGTLTEIACVNALDSAKVDIADGKWTINANATGHQDYVFARQ
jgi:hypothetical protein